MATALNPSQCDQHGGKAALRDKEPVDLSHLRRFTLGDRNLELEILALFVEQVPVTLAALKRAETDRDWTMAAHTLKGSARAVGAWRLATLAERAEGLGGPSDRAARDGVLRHLDEAAAEARAHIVSLGAPR